MLTPSSALPRSAAPTSPIAPIVTSGVAATPGTAVAALIAATHRGALCFGGNGAPWLDELRTTLAACPAAWPYIVGASERLQQFAAQQRVQWSGQLRDGFDVLGWLRGTTPLPAAAAMVSGVLSQPGIFLAQVARFIQLSEAGLRPLWRDREASAAITTAVGYSQGLMTAVLVSEAIHRGALTVERVGDFAVYLAWQGWCASAWWQEVAPDGQDDNPADRPAMVAISGLELAVLQAQLRAEIAAEPVGAGGLAIAMVNTRTRHVVSGCPEALARLHIRLKSQAKTDAAQRQAGQLCGPLLTFDWLPLTVDSPYHCPALAPCMAPMRAAMQREGFTLNSAELAIDVLDTHTGEALRDQADLLETVMRLQFMAPVSWVQITRALSARRLDFILDFGVGPGIARMTASGLRGHGIRVLSLSEPSGRRALLTTPLDTLSTPMRYSDFAPSLVTLADGTTHIDNAYTRATGQSPMILPGMTPTTADVPLVAAAANAGFTAELAGGGQVTASIFKRRMDELRTSLEPGISVTFNALFMDRHLWQLQLGEQKLVQKARKSGVPIAGVTISAGVPEPAEGAALLDELNGLGMHLNAFKPGTQDQIKQVLAIADAAPQHTVFLHLEGGKAGGHHSWEDLEALLLGSYHQIRQRANVILCVGGGIADEARATALLVGDWALAHGLCGMPIDAVLLGTITMACAEAKTSPQVKAALAAAGGTPDWIARGEVRGGITSGRSQHDADIHYLDNAAARCARLLDVISRDVISGEDGAATIDAHRDEIIAALSRTAKPWFGDFLAMSWHAILSRMLALMAIGRGELYDDGPWLDPSFRARFADTLWLAEGRLLGAMPSSAFAAPDPVESVLTSVAALDEPHAVLQLLLTRYPAAATQTPHPSDRETFIRQICARPGKPINFVPVIDTDIRRWYAADALWQSHDSRLDADRVLIIPGPAAVRGIHHVDEPIAALLGRFDAAVVAHLRASATPLHNRNWLRVAPERDPSSGLYGGFDEVLEAAEGDASTTWRATSHVAADSWFTALTPRFSGLVAQVFAADVVFSPRGVQPNPIRRLCPADPGATLVITTATTASSDAATVTWHAPRAAGPAATPAHVDSIHLARSGDTIDLTIGVPALFDRAGAPWTLSFRVDSAGRVHLHDVDAHRIRAFYGRNLFGESLSPVALFEVASDLATVSPAEALAYARLSRDRRCRLGDQAHAGLVFSLGFRPLMRALSCDALALGLPSLVHLRHAVHPGAGWPIHPGESLRATARIGRIAKVADGTRVDATISLYRDSQHVAAADESFFLRGFQPDFTLRAAEPFAQRLLVIDDATRRFVLAHSWLTFSTPPVVGEVLLFEGQRTVQRSRDVVAFGAHGTVMGRTARGQLQLSERHDPAHSGAHPLTALLRTLVAHDVHDLETMADPLSCGGTADTDVERAPPPGRLLHAVYGDSADLAVAIDRAPDDLAAWAAASADANPIHRSLGAARLAGLRGPIVHGMWTSARARTFVIATCCDGQAARLEGFDVRFEAPLQPGAALELRVTRVGAVGGHALIGVIVTTEAGVVLRAQARIAPPRTAYVFPGQGIQTRGMGMAGYERSPAARAIWHAVDDFTRENLGFSLLHVVRTNPKQLICQGRKDVHERGVLHLTQYTQVAMATLAQAQVAELREAGALVEDAVLCGHSIGEYNAVSAIAGVLSLQTVVSVVWARGMAMHACVPRDATGRSGYAMGVIRPHHACTTTADGVVESLDHDATLALVAAVAEETGGFVEIVNFNVHERQYAVVGELAALAVLSARLFEMARPDRKTPWVQVPGVDVPFHSTRLRTGVAAFRLTLRGLLPEKGFLKLIGRYVPNLVALPFSLERDFVAAMLEATGAPEVAALLADHEVLVVDAEAFARTLLIELFAFQFASPVRWIESQALLFRPIAHHGLGVVRFIEIGVATQPTTANMAHQTLAAMAASGRAVRVLNSELDGPEVRMQRQNELPSMLDLALDTGAAEASEAPEAPEAQPMSTAPAPAGAVASAPMARLAPDDQAVSPLQGLRTLLALQANVRAEQVRDGETIDDLFNGVSSRRNQALVDMGVEFDAGAIDGAHEQPIADLAGLLAERNQGWRCPGGYLDKAHKEAVRRVFGRVGWSQSDMSARLSTRFGLGDGLVAAAMNHLCLATRDGDSARGGALGDVAPLAATDAGSANAALDRIVASLGAAMGVPFPALAGEGSGGSASAGTAVDAAVVDALEARILGPEGLFATGLTDFAVRLAASRDTAADDRAAELADRVAVTAAAQETSAMAAHHLAIEAEHGPDWSAWVAGRFSAQRHVPFTSAWAWARRDVALLYHQACTGQLTAVAAQAWAARLAPFAREDAAVADAARYFAVLARGRVRAADVAVDVAVAPGAAPDAAPDVAGLLDAISAGAALPQRALRPSRPQVHLDAAGVRTYADIVDKGDDAISRWLAALRPVDRNAHVRLAAPDADAAFFAQLSDAATTPLDFGGRTALVTGASPGSIAVEVVRHLLRGGARVVVTTSNLGRARLAWYGRLYQDHAAPGAELHVVPFNQASHEDITALVDWLFAHVTEPDGASTRTLKRAFTVDLVLPFAAVGDAATLDRLGPRADLAMRVMLTGVERLIAAIGARFIADGRPAQPVQVVLPLSPNHGGFGGDGLYAETKAGLEVLCNKWVSEHDAWGATVALCAAQIGWVRGTGLMDANDMVAAELEARTGARTFSSAEMGWLLAGLCTKELGAFAHAAPLRADLGGGFARIARIREVVTSIRTDLDQAARVARDVAALGRSEADFLGSQTDSNHEIKPLPSWPPSWPTSLPSPSTDTETTSAAASSWPALTASLDHTVVIVGVGELGPCGNARTRWALEVQDRLAPAAVLELAWLCGLITWRAAARGGSWVDVASDTPVAEAEVADRYRAAVRAASGIRWVEPKITGFDPDALPVLAIAWLDRDFTFDVADEAEAQSFLAADPDHTHIAHKAGRWRVTRTQGAEVRVPRISRLNRRVLGMLPTGLNLARLGIPGAMIETVDRVSLVNLVATADAFLNAGMTPAELLAHVHPARVANTQGSGLGGMASLRRLFTDQLLDRPRQGDIVQEGLINVVAAYTVQSYVGSYGPMVHPVGACATAAVSLEAGMDKILSGRADFSIAGGFDDLTSGSTLGFADMQATADTDQMTAMGIEPDQMCRSNDVRRRGFLEAQGGGTLLLCRASVARDLGLPVRGVLAWAGSFSDGIQTSIPAPGLGVVAAAMGGKRSPLALALTKFGLTTDDIALVYKHDTSTAANDPNENLIHHTIQRALGRTVGNPLFVVSQKTLTGHSKGGAAAFQTIGLCQALAEGTIAGNRNLQSVDPAMACYTHLTFTDTALQSADPLRAGLVTSLGFGHVGAIALLLHPDAFAAILLRDDQARESQAELSADTEEHTSSHARWQHCSQARQRAAFRRRCDILQGRTPLFEPRTDHGIATQEEELAMLLDPDGRLPGE